MTLAIGPCPRFVDHFCDDPESPETDENHQADGYQVFGAKRDDSSFHLESLVSAGSPLLKLADK